MTIHHDEDNLPDYETGDQVARQALTAFAVIGAILALVVGAVLLAMRGFSGEDQTAAPDPTPTETAEPTPTMENPCPVTDVTPNMEPAQFDAVPDPATAAGVTKGTIKTSCGDIEVDLYAEQAPQAVASFAHLAKENFWANTLCHRLVTSGIFVLQCGDPTATGVGGPGYNFGPVENAPEDDIYEPGVLAMARQGHNGDSMGSQFFIVYEQSEIPSDTAGGYTVFGKVTSGLDIVEKIAQGGVGPDATAPAWPIALTEVTIS